MKKTMILAALTLCMLLTGCSRLVEKEYLSVTPHVEQYSVEENDDALTAENYLSLKNAILSFVQNGVERGVIRIYDYSGNVEDDLAAATYDVSKNDPLGAYAVDYMTHDCQQIVSYYEAHINITFRRTVAQIDDIQRVGSNNSLPDQIYAALAAYDDVLTMRVAYYNEPDIQNLVRQYYKQHPLTQMQLPELTVNVYPDTGYVRIVEVLFSYDQTPQSLKDKQEAVATSVRASKEYVRYRETQTEKLQLLFTYLMERFQYEFSSTTTPVYSFLCEGVADSESCAKSLQIICDQIGVECFTVEGFRGGEPYTWNIVNVDGVYCHTDLLRSMQAAGDQLTLYKDAAMNDYSWDAAQYPVCE